MEPEGALDNYCSSIRDIYENRYLIRELPYKEWIVEKVGGIILSTINDRKRFRQLPCLKVLRAIVRDNYSPPLSKDTVSILFGIYRHYIFSGKPDYEWCVSSLIKDRELNSDEIEWLIDNWDKSDHLVNRLLRYPTDNRQVSDWAKERYEKDELLERKSELMARFIDGEFSSLLENEESPAALTWAVYYSLSDIKAKEEMLIRIASLHDEENLLEVCSRLELSEPLKVILKAHHT